MPGGASRATDGAGVPSWYLFGGRGALRMLPGSNGRGAGVTYRRRLLVTWALVNEGGIDCGDRPSAVSMGSWGTGGGRTHRVWVPSPVWEGVTTTSVPWRPIAMGASSARGGAG